ncbi:winged helix-turn-helix transcriptional regulator [Candidatus Micrarchaeota archaeon]|nr:winged helix-turn-helix transcriptional regulator [Candidatus Micrarchaeota archaeon]
MQEKLVIDRETLRALGADTRVNILKKLSDRRKTQAELAAELDLAPPSVKEHVQRLAQAGLVKRIESQHKWKYYELTEKGAALVQPTETRIWFMLAISLVAVAASFTSIYSMFPAQPGFASVQQEEAKVMAAATGPMMADAAQAAAPPGVLSSLPPLETTFFLVGLLAAGVCIGLLLKNRR